MFYLNHFFMKIVCGVGNASEIYTKSVWVKLKQYYNVSQLTKLISSTRFDRETKYSDWLFSDSCLFLVFTEEIFNYGSKVQNSRKICNARFSRFLKVSFKIGETFKQFSDYRSGIKSRASKMERSWRRRGAAARSSQTAAELRLSFKEVDL